MKRLTIYFTSGGFLLLGGLFLLFTSASLSGGDIEANLKSRVPWKKLKPGLMQAGFDYETDKVTENFHVQVFKLSLSDYEPVAIDARGFGPDGETATAREMARKSGAFLVINGSFFDEKNRPLGLVISGGKRINPFRKADWGVLSVVDGEAALVHTKDWNDEMAGKASFALQVGPRVVVKGKPTQLKPQVARRAAIGIKPGGKELLVVVTDAGRAEANDFAGFMASPERIGGMGVIDAVLMDGGPSAQLYAKIGDKITEVPGGWPVPIGVAFMERVKR